MAKAILIISAMFLFSCVGSDDNSTPEQEIVTPEIFEVEFYVQGSEKTPGQEVFQTSDTIQMEIRSKNNSENTILEINVYLLPSTTNYFPTETYEIVNSDNNIMYRMSNIEMEWYDYGEYRIELRILTKTTASEIFVKYMTHEGAE
ncbi:MAG: hypothetical protein GY710_06185 [Desulfobacteraceae bacterium]|nr:hypothetical protein [Desulfobacteraceae bacterium]